MQQRIFIWFWWFIVQREKLGNTLATYLPRWLLKLALVRIAALTSFHYPTREMGDLRPADMMRALQEYKGENG
jgi:hypothetical protein